MTGPRSADVHALAVAVHAPHAASTDDPARPCLECNVFARRALTSGVVVPVDAVGRALEAAAQLVDFLGDESTERGQDLDALAHRTSAAIIRTFASVLEHTEPRDS